MLNVSWISDQDVQAFPAPETALKEPDGLLLLGGNLSTTSLLNAYRSGVFPWFEEGQPIMWWSPSVRAIIPTDAVHISKNMAKLRRRGCYRVTADEHFAGVIDACSDREQTWITATMRQAYIDLHEKGIAHSIEVFEGETLVGGLYGVFVKNCFCGESMFSRKTNASKMALIELAHFLLHNNCRMIDCQLPTRHLFSMGAVALPRADFIAKLQAMPDNALLSEKRWSDVWRTS